VTYCWQHMGRNNLVESDGGWLVGVWLPEFFLCIELELELESLRLFPFSFVGLSVLMGF